MKKEKCYNCGDVATTTEPISRVPLCNNCENEVNENAKQEIEDAETEGKELEFTN